MPHIGRPLRIPELSLMPEPTGAIPLSNDMQQSLSLLTGFWRNKRVLLKATPSGSLCTTEAVLKNIIHVTADGDNDTYKGDNIPCSGVTVMGHPDNTGKVWVRSHIEATINNAWPLEKWDVVEFTFTNLNMLNLLIENNGEKAIIAYLD